MLFVDDSCWSACFSKKRACLFFLLGVFACFLSQVVLAAPESPFSLKAISQELHRPSQIASQERIPTSSYIGVFRNSKKADVSPNATALWPNLIAHFAFLADAERPAVTKAIRHYLLHPKAVERLFINAKPYIAFVYQETLRRHMPAEFALLPMVESGYRPFAYSPTGAVGLWQIMPSLASNMNLGIDWWYDRRRDIVLSTHAALNFLSRLKEHLGNWYLAMASYDAGESLVLKKIADRKRKGLATDYWSLSLPKEAQVYVPKLIALAYLLVHAKDYHLHLPHLNLQTDFVHIPLTEQIDLGELSHLSGVSSSELKRLNAGLRRFATNPGRPYAVVLPRSSLMRFAQQVSHSRDIKRISWQYHEVHRGETLAVIAKNYHTSVAKLRRTNHLSADQHLIAGEGILVPLYLGHTFSHLLDFNGPPFSTMDDRRTAMTLERSRVEAASHRVDAVTARSLLGV